MAYTNAQLQALEDAYAAGVLTVSFKGRTTTYASEADLAKRISYVKGQLAAASSTQPVRTILTYQDDES